MRVEHLGHRLSHILCARANQNHEPSSAQIVHMAGERSRFCTRACDLNERALEARQESVAGAARVDSLQAGVSVQHVDVVRLNPNLKQRVDGRFSILLISNRACDAIDGVVNK
jgi:hypothetical protein